MLNPTSPGEQQCELSPQARAFSTVLMTYVGSIITGASSGHHVVFFIAWMCWLAPLRLLAIGIWALFEAISGRRLKGGDQYHDFWSRFSILSWIFTADREWDTPFFRGAIVKSRPTALGWVGWAYRNIYTPISQILWVAGNWNSASAGLKVVRAMGMWVTALPFTIDTQARYGDDLEERFGTWCRHLFSLVSAINCLVLTILSMCLLIHGVSHANIPRSFLLYLIGACFFWTRTSFVFQVPHDGAKGLANPRAIIAGMAMGCFAGCLVAGPAFTLFETEPDNPGSDLVTYIGCEPLAVWRKFIAIFP